MYTQREKEGEIIPKTDFKQQNRKIHVNISREKMGRAW